MSIWGGLHAGFLFWSIKYPFNYRMFKLAGRTRYAHIISVVLAVVVPLPLALAHLKSGFIITANPSLVCVGRNRDYTYYTFILPISIIVAITSNLLVLIFWTVLKVRNTLIPITSGCRLVQTTATAATSTTTKQYNNNNNNNKQDNMQ